MENVNGNVMDQIDYIGWDCMTYANFKKTCDEPISSCYCQCYTLYSNLFALFKYGWVFKNVVRDIDMHVYIYSD